MWLSIGLNASVSFWRGIAWSSTIKMWQELSIILSAELRNQNGKRYHRLLLFNLNSQLVPITCIKDLVSQHESDPRPVRPVPLAKLLDFGGELLEVVTAVDRLE